jgi:hypothetical protein
MARPPKNISDREMESLGKERDANACVLSPLLVLYFIIRDYKKERNIWGVGGAMQVRFVSFLQTHGKASRTPARVGIWDTMRR